MKEKCAGKKESFSSGLNYIRPKQIRQDLNCSTGLKMDERINRLIWMQVPLALRTIDFPIEIRLQITFALLLQYGMWSLYWPA